MRAVYSRPMRPSEIHVLWHDRSSGRVVNASGLKLVRVRVVLVGAARIRGRRAWYEDRSSLGAGEGVAFTRLELDGPAMLRVRWKVDLSQASPWLWVEVPVPARPARVPGEGVPLGQRPRL